MKQLLHELGGKGSQKNIKFTPEVVDLLDEWKGQGLSYQDTVDAAVTYAFNHSLFGAKLESMKLKKALDRSAKQDKMNVKKRTRRESVRKGGHNE